MGGDREGVVAHFDVGVERAIVDLDAGDARIEETQLHSHRNHIDRVAELLGRQITRLIYNRSCCIKSTVP